jgi:GlpG protein
MRSLTILEGQANTEAFVAYLLTQNISTHVEPTDSDKTRWEVWIRDEDKLPQAQQELQQFLADPGNPRYQQAVRDARSILKEQREQAAARQRNIQTPREISRNSMFGGVLPPLTLTLIVLCSVLSVVSEFAKPRSRLGNSIVKQLMFADMVKYERTKDPAVSLKDYQWWRVLTPMFLHGHPFHLIMNMLALASLGRIAERLEGSKRYFVLIIALAIGSHLPQGLLPQNLFGIQGLSGSPSFVGISGVVLGLFGYIATKTYLRRDIGFTLSPTSYFMVGLILFLGFAGDIAGTGGAGGMKMANFAHLGGLITGIVIGWLMSNPSFDRRRRES